MKITLEREAELKKYEYVSEILISQNRPDIQKILKADDYSSLPDRLKNYLVSLNLVTEEGNLTSEGKIAINEGVVSEIEYGWYETWNLIGDPWLKNKLVAFKRKRPGKSETKNEWIKTLIDIPNESYAFDYEKNGQTKIEKVDIKSTNKMTKGSTPANLVFSADSSGINFQNIIEADVKWSENKSNHIKVENILDESITQILELIPNFDSNHKRMKIEAPANEKEIISFERKRMELEPKDCNLSDYGLFSKVTLENVSLMPKDKYEAKTWLKKIMLIQWKNRYISMEQTQINQEDWISEIPLKMYKLDSDFGENLLKNIGAENTEVYWNVAAMQDLVPASAKLKISFTRKPSENDLPDYIHSQIKELIK